MTTNPPTYREQFTCAFLGLYDESQEESNNKDEDSKFRKPHAVANLSPYQTVEDWIQSLGRSARTTMKRVTRILEQSQIQVRCVGTVDQVLGYEHWSVCFDHETRATGSRLKGFGVACLRYMVAVCGEGWIDEYRDVRNSRLLAWTCMIGKGKTMRSMWFYQRSEASKCSIWFHSVRLAVERSLVLELAHLDLGPSKSDDVKELKTKYGFHSTCFHSTLDWDATWSENVSSENDNKCCYVGPFVDMSQFVKQKGA